MSDFIYKLSEDSDFLMHHGIKGQKWGVENGPPYPLNPSKDYTKAEQKALLKEVKKNLKKVPHIVREQYTDIQNIKSIKDEINSDQIKQLKDNIYNKMKAVNAANKPFEKVDYDESKLTEEQRKKYRQAYDDITEAWNKYNQYANKVVNNLVGKYGNVKVDKAKNSFEKKYFKRTFEHEVRKAIDYALENEWANDPVYHYYGTQVEKW